MTPRQFKAYTKGIKSAASGAKVLKCPYDCDKQGAFYWCWRRGVEDYRTDPQGSLLLLRGNDEN